MFMNEEYLPEIAIQADDYARLESLVDNEQTDRSPVLDYLERELSRARIVASGDCLREAVNMHSTVTYHDRQTGQERTVTLVYPHEADINVNKISVLSPIGAALIGMFAGESIAWYAPNQQKRVLEVLRINN